MSFKVGDVCIIVGCETLPALNGRECTIVSPLAEHNTILFGLISCYTVSLESGTSFFATPEVLRKKEPPRKDLDKVEWNSVPWVPKELIS